MTDISKCDGERCTRKDKCYRHVVSEDDLWQSWTASPPLCEDGCADFIPVREEEGSPRSAFTPNLRCPIAKGCGCVFDNQEETVSEDLFVIVDHRKPWTDCALFWRENRSGYTFQLDEAGRYSREEAMAIHVNRKTDIPVPLSLALARIKQHVGREIVNEVTHLTLVDDHVPDGGEKVKP